MPPKFAEEASNGAEEASKCTEPAASAAVQPGPPSSGPDKGSSETSTAAADSSAISGGRLPPPSPVLVQSAERVLPPPAESQLSAPAPPTVPLYGRYNGGESPFATMQQQQQMKSGASPPIQNAWVSTRRGSGGVLQPPRAAGARGVARRSSPQLSQSNSYGRSSFPVPDPKPYVGSRMPDNEAKRCEALCALSILNTEADPRFDDITNLVSSEPEAMSINPKSESPDDSSATCPLSSPRRACLWKPLVAFMQQSGAVSPPRIPDAAPPPPPVPVGSLP